MNGTEFRERIRTSLANPTLQIALDANAERRVNGRINVLATLRNWREKRQQAYGIRAEVIEHLDEFLAGFIRKATENGISLHRAKDAEEAIRIILEIVKDSTHREKKEAFVSHGILPGKEVLVAKSKSAVVITGPSRTGDIEMSLTISMHGPGEVHVFLVHSTASTLVHGTASTLVDD